MGKRSKINLLDEKTVTLGAIEKVSITNDVSEDYIEGKIDLFETKNEVKPSNINFSSVKELDYKGRGFNTIDEAFAFIDTDYFKGLGQADQDEFINWLY